MYILNGALKNLFSPVEGFTKAFNAKMANESAKIEAMESLKAKADGRTNDGGYIKGLSEEGFTNGIDYIVEHVPNIVDISYGRGVGYTFTEHVLDDNIQNISATKIRAEMRKDGKIA